MVISGPPAGRRTSIAAAFALAIGGLTLAAAPSAMALDAPSGLAQESSEAAGPGIPVLRWDGVLGATAYEVKIGTAAAVTTTNTRYVPTNAIAATTTEFQVRAKIGSSSYSEWALGNLSVAQGNGPELLTPAHGAVLQQPGDAPLLTWDAVNGALDYQVQYSQNPAFTGGDDVVKTQTTKSPQALLATALVAQKYYWRARARIGTGIYTAWSADPAGSSTARWFEIAPLGLASRNTPATDDTVQTDVIFDWDPIPGAVTYDLQISPNENFAAGTESGLTQILNLPGTRYSPPKSLANDQYYWRVRAKDASGNVQDWGVPSVWRFQRDWTEQPSLVYPENNSTVGNPFYYQWSPVKWASSYRVDVSTNEFFTGVSTSSCTTTNTTYTPFQAGNECRPASNGTYYWRVVAFDGPPSGNAVNSTDVIGAQVRRFSFYPTLVNYAAPADQASVQVPTLSWEPVAGASTYEVKITGVSANATGSYTSTTAALSHTPSQLEHDCANLPGVDPFTPCLYRWDVIWKNEDGNSGPARSPLTQHAFRTAQPSAPSGAFNLNATVASERVPALSWDPVAGAKKYRVYAKSISALETNAGTLVDNTTTQYPALTPAKVAFLPPDTYRWRVEALTENNTVFADSGFQSTFTVQPVPETANRRLGLTGAAVTYETATGVTCTLANCQNVRSTPVLRWDPYPNTGYYELYISNNKEHTNPVPGYPTKVYGTIYAPTRQLDDKQAGSAYYWFVRPCTAQNVCGELRYAENDFNQLSNPVERVGTGVACTQPGTASPTVESDDLTFCWRDFLETNSTIGQGTSELATPGQVEAKHYHIQTSINPTFASTLDDVHVDQTTFTSLEAYPEGTIYWRVRAVDGTGNFLTWSTTGTLLKQSPVATLSEPAHAASVGGDVTLRWNPVDYAARYTVEVYKNGDTTAQLANRAVNASSVHAAWTGASPLAPGTYAWRVQRFDAGNNAGGWSPMRTFTVTGRTPSVISPINSIEVLPNGTLFSWSPVPRAATYRLERRAVGSGSSTTMLSSTTATQWAATTTLADGSWQWRVIATDLNAQPLGTSDWAEYSVSGRLAVVEAPRIQGSGAVDTQVSAFDPVWNRAGVHNSYQWYRGAAAIPGATDATYLVTSADYGKAISLRVTGTHPDYIASVAVSNVLNGAAAPAVIETVRPLIDGTGEVGTALELSQWAEWENPAVKPSYAWMVGTRVLRNDGTTFKPLVVTTAHVGTPIVLRVTGTLTGYANSVLYSNEIMPIPADALKATAPVTITGTPTLGSRLRASGPTWDQTRVTASYQWYRNNVAVAGATSSRYTVTTADLTRKLTVRVVGAKQGYASASALSKPVTVPKVVSATGLKVSATKLRVRKKLTMTVSVKASGLSRVTGKVTFMDGKKKLKTVSLNTKSTAVFSTKKLKRGKHKLRVVYAGTGTVAPSKSVVVKVVVTK